MPWWGWLIIYTAGPVCIFLIWLIVANILIAIDIFGEDDELAMAWPISIPLIIFWRTWENAKIAWIQANKVKSYVRNRKWLRRSSSNRILERGSAR